MVTNEAEPVLTEEHGDVLLVKLNRPEKLNAWNTGLSHGLDTVFRRVATREIEPRAIVVTGEGRAFCAGGDVTSFPPADPSRNARPAYARPHPERSMAHTMHHCDVPVIGAINGYAVGLGFGLALCTDVRIAADDAVFQVAQTKRGLMADFSLPHLLREAVGNQRCLELMFTGRRVDAQEALALGLVLRVASRDALIEEALAFAAEVAKGPPLGMAASKHVTYMNEEPALSHAEEFTTLSIAGLFGTEDAREGVQSFRERREPHFRGR